MAQIYIQASKVLCRNCRKDAGIAKDLVCRCGEKMRCFTHGRRWVCIVCGNTIPVPPCDCYLLLDIEVNGTLALPVHAAT